MNIDISFQKDAVKNHLQSYLLKVSNFQNLDRDMKLILYLRQSDNDFIAFEACEFSLGFISSAYKVSDFFLLQQEHNLLKYSITFNQLCQLVA